MKKLEELAAKTGLNGPGTRRLFGFGALGLLAAALAGLAGCVGLQVKKAPAQGPALQNYDGGGAAPGAAQNSPAAAPAGEPVKKPAESCGPYPGYPCGTRYFTVSVRDFFRKVFA